MPRAPEGGHSNHAGTLLDGAPVALADDPPAVAVDDDVDLVPPETFDRVAVAPAPDAELVAAGLEVEPVAAVPAVVVDVD